MVVRIAFHYTNVETVYNNVMSIANNSEYLYMFHDDVEQRQIIRTEIPRYAIKNVIVTQF